MIHTLDSYVMWIPLLPSTKKAGYWSWIDLMSSPASYIRKKEKKETQETNNKREHHTHTHTHSNVTQQFML